MPSRASEHDSITSLLFRSHISNTPEENNLSETEAMHRNALEVAQAKHQRVRESALRAYNNNELKVALERLLRLQSQEVERIRLETEHAALATTLQDLQQKTIPLPPPPAPVPAELKQEATTAVKNSSSPQIAPQDGVPTQALQSTTQANTELRLSKPPPEIAPTALLDPPLMPPIQVDQVPEIKTGIAAASHLSASRPTAPSGRDSALNTDSQPTYPGADDYLEIHKQLKRVRAYTMEIAKQNPAIKKRVGEMRREIRKSMGQLTEGKGANKTPTGVIHRLLSEALRDIPSPPVNPGIFMLSIPNPSKGAPNNSDTLPLLFIYLLNVFSKAIIAQLVDEAGVSTRFADPIGVIAASTFSQAEFCWRGKSLIDILVCKFRVVCPVLFGIRGNEKTEEGLKRVGWWRSDSGEWVSDQVHNVRMTGLGAGYAAISLRDFSKSKNQNPYPPTKYWQSMAAIVATPPDQTSSTQCIVLKAMIENFEQRFLNFYGNAARAALRVALVDFPNRALEKNVAVASLKVLAEKIQRDAGLQL